MIKSFWHAPWLLCIPIAILSGCSADESLDRASAQCDAQIIASRVESVDRVRFKNLCMRATGYQRNVACDALPIYMASNSQCYTAAWKFWVEKATLVE